MSVGRGVTHRWGGAGAHGHGGVPRRNSRRGSSFQPPGVVLLFGLHLAPASHGGKPLRFGDRHGIRQEGPIVRAESMSLGLKVETNGPRPPPIRRTAYEGN